VTNWENRGPDETQHLPGTAPLPGPEGPAPTQPLGPFPGRGSDWADGPPGSALARAALQASLLAVGVSVAAGLALGLLVAALVGRLGVWPCAFVVVLPGPLLNLYQRPFRAIAQYTQWRQGHPEQPVNPQDADTLRWARGLALLAPLLWLILGLALVAYFVVRLR
jgi:hypothetical protein